MKKVLVVDDSPSARKSLVEYLEHRGVAFDLATNGREARQCLKSSAEEYTLVFLDLDLGWDVSDGEGILAWMEGEGYLIPTVIVSEAASHPVAIRLASAYSKMVRTRISHGDVAAVRAVLDGLLFRDERGEKIAIERRGSIGREVLLWLGGLAGVFVLLIAAFAILELSKLWLFVISAVGLFCLVGVLVLVTVGVIKEGTFLKIIREVLSLFKSEIFRRRSSKGDT